MKHFLKVWLLEIVSQSDDGDSKSREIGGIPRRAATQEDTNDCYAAALGGETLTRNPHLDRMIPCLGILESFIVVGFYAAFSRLCIFANIST